MNPETERKIAELEKIIAHLEMQEGQGLKSSLDESKEEPPAIEVESEPVEKKESLVIAVGKPKKSFNDKADEMIAQVDKKKPLEAAMESVEAAPGEEEMTDSELEELVKKYLGNS